MEVRRTQAENRRLCFIWASRTILGVGEQTSTGGGRSQEVRRRALAANAAAQKPRLGPLRAWFNILGGLAVFALLLFWGVYLLDYFLVSGMTAQPSSAVSHYFGFNAELLTDALPALGMTIVAVFGIVLTVVAIIVQLSSERYTGVALMFLRDPTNIGVMCFYVVAGLCSIWLSVSLQPEFVPRALLVGVMIAASFGLALMLPYFAYVFWFLEPGNIVGRIGYQASRLARHGVRSATAERTSALQQRVLVLVEEITDIANNSIAGKDKIIASRAVDGLRDFMLEYIASKPAGDHAWFHIGQDIRENPDFVAMDHALLAQLEQRGLWVEWKALRQYLGIYNEALMTMQDINYLIAIDTRYVGEAAAAGGHRELVSMVLRFMNSYLRSAINQGSVRTAYNVLHQYRLLIESWLQLGQTDAALSGIRHFKYYGRVACDEKLPFITETVAYDLATLCEFANREGLPVEEVLLEELLDLNRSPGNAQKAQGLRGVRKAQIKLATHYLSAGIESKARVIARDMANEPSERLQSFCEELGRETFPDFWEVIDRGSNFDYLPEAQRSFLPAFLALLPS
jgi:hypothetical protein